MRRARSRRVRDGGPSLRQASSPKVLVPSRAMLANMATITNKNSGMPRGETSMGKRKWSRREVLGLPRSLAAECSSPSRPEPRCLAVCRHAGTDRGREEGRQGLLLRGYPARRGRKAGKDVRGQISRAYRCAWNAPAPSGFSSASRRSRAAASMRSTSPTRPMFRIISNGRRTAGSRHTCRKRS